MPFIHPHAYLSSNKFLPFNLTTGETIYPFHYAVAGYAGFDMKFFSKDGTMLKRFNNVVDFNSVDEKVGFLYFGNNQFAFITARKALTVSFKITYLAGTLTVTKFRTVQSVNDFLSSGLIGDFAPGTTTYGYSGIRDSTGAPDSRVVKIDLTNPGPTYSTGYLQSTSFYRNSDLSITWMFISSNVILHTYFNTGGIIFFDKTTLNEINTMSSQIITSQSTASSSIIYSGLVNNLIEKELYLVHRYWTGTDYIAISPWDSTTINPMTRIAATLIMGPSLNDKQASIVNVGAFNYLLCFSESANTFEFLYKNPFSFVLSRNGTFTLPGAFATTIYSGKFSGEMVGDGFVITRRQTSNLNFQSFILRIDRCFNRDPITGICSQCSSDYVLTSTKADNMCISRTSIPSGYGLDVSTNSLLPCAASYCTGCVDSYLFCTVCNQTANAFLNPVLGTCSTIKSMPDGYGVEPISMAVVRCLDSFCFKCAINYQFCTQCRTDLGYFLYPATSRCLLNTTLNPKFGIEKAVPGVSVGLVKACADTYCLNCFEDYAMCTACDVSADYYANTTTSSCVYFNDFPQGWGVNNAAGRVEKCASQGCLDCYFDKSVCDKCDTSLAIYLDGTVCKDYLSAPFGMGIDYESGLLAKCSIPNCADCKFNYTVCDRCDQDKFFFKMFDSCVYKDCAANGANCKITLVSSRFDKKSASAIVLLSHDVKSYPALRSYLNITLLNEITGKENVLSPEECSIEVISSGLRLYLNITYQVLQGTINIRKIRGLNTNPLFDSAQNKEFKDYPLKIPNAVIITSKVIKTTQDGTDSIVKAAAMIKSIVGTALMSSNPALAVIMNKVLSEFSYIRLLNGPLLIYPTIVLEGFGNMLLLPISIDNPFESFTAKSICPTNEMLDVFDVKCNFLYNYGTDLTILLINLSISLAVMLFFYIMLATSLKTVKKSSIGRKKSLLYKVCNFLNGTLGLQYFLVIMEGGAQEIVVYSYINISSPLSDFPLHIGALLSLVFLGFYGFYCYAVYILAKQVDKKVRRAKADWVRTEKGETRTLDSVISFDGMKYENLSFVYDGYRYPLTLFQLCYPIFSMLRVILLCMFLMSLDAAGFTQLGSVLLIEACFAYLNTKTKVKASRAEQRLELMTMLLNCIYIFIKMFTFAPFDYDTKQNYLGIPMALVLVLVVVASLGFVLLTVISAIYETIEKNFIGGNDKIDINDRLEREKEKIRRKDMRRDPNYVYVDDIDIPEKKERMLMRRSGMALAKYKFRMLCIMRNSSSRGRIHLNNNHESTEESSTLNVHGRSRKESQNSILIPNQPHKKHKPHSTILKHQKHDKSTPPFTSISPSKKILDKKFISASLTSLRPLPETKKIVKRASILNHKLHK